MLSRLREDIGRAWPQRFPNPKRLGSAATNPHLAVSLLKNPYVNGGDHSSRRRHKDGPPMSEPVLNDRGDRSRSSANNESSREA